MKKSFNVFGAKIKVKSFKETPETAHIMGYAVKQDNTIFISDSISPNQVSSTLTHELMHHLIFRIGLDQVLTQEIQEIICEAVSKFVDENYNFKK